MTNPTSGDVHVNSALTNISIAFLQDASAFVAERVFPNIPVSKQSDVFHQYDRGDFNRDEADVRAPSTESKGGGYRMSTAPYFAKVFAFHKDIDDQTRANADAAINMDNDATNFVTHKCLIKREKEWSSSFFTTSVWTTDTTGVASSPSTDEVLQWNDANSTPIEDIRARKTAVLQSTGFEPNKLVVGREVWDSLVDHPDIIDRLKAGQTPIGPATANRAKIAEILEIDEILVMNAIENTAKEGATATHAFIGGKNALLVYSTPTPGLLVPSGGYTFSWTGFLGAGSQGNRMKKFRMEQLSSDRVECEMAFDQKLISADLGRFFTTIVA